MLWNGKGTGERARGRGAAPRPARRRQIRAGVATGSEDSTLEWVVGPGPPPEATGNGADPATRDGPEPAADPPPELELRFDQLRALGLSPIESAQVLAKGDLRARFDSERDLDDLPDFSDELISRLKGLARG